MHGRDSALPTADLAAGGLSAIPRPPAGRRRLPVLRVAGARVHVGPRWPATRDRARPVHGLDPADEWNDSRAGTALAKIALRDADSKPVQIAVMSSATNHVGEMLATIFSEKNPPANLVEQLIGLATAMNER